MKPSRKPRPHAPSPHFPQPDATDAERYLAVRPAMPAMPPVLLCRSLLKLLRHCKRRWISLWRQR
ncbi:MAG: hypothetical protein HWE26_21360 [Alteromonadaceae bacterium]|nr:hypothetical protein [Alteromonadaceae bacterium]